MVSEMDPMQEVDKKTTPHHHRMESGEPPCEPSLIRAWPGQIVFAPTRSPAPETDLDNNNNPLDPETSAFQKKNFITCSLYIKK